MKGTGADISNICEYKWYEWVKYLDTACTYPGNKWVLGRCLGPAPDVGSMMTSNILRHTGNHIPRSTLRPLQDWEITDPYQIEQRLKFDRLVNNALGKTAVETDFPWEFLTPLVNLMKIMMMCWIDLLTLSLYQTLNQSLPPRPMTIMLMLM